MDLKQYRLKLIGSKEERAVSPVIGVILMVAITVILAAVIAAFVLDMGDMGDQAPSTQFSFDEDVSNEEVEISVTGGENVDPDNLFIETGEISERVSDGRFSGWDVDELSAGDSATLTVSNTDYKNDGDTIQLVWKGDGDSQILDEFETTDTS